LTKKSDLDLRRTIEILTKVVKDLLMNSKEEEFESVFIQLATKYSVDSIVACLNDRGAIATFVAKL